MNLENISVSVVLPVYISKPSNITDTVKCIELLKTKTAIPFELVIVETCSDYFIEDADIYLNERVRTTANKSINRAFKLCDTDYVVFIGNDVMVDDNWLESLIACFNKEDCGIATLGNSEHNDVKADEIKEEMYFSICMFKKEDAWFDDFYTFIFDDTDMIFRIYVSGRKCYKNLNTIVQHKPHSTLGQYCGNKAEYDRCREYFRDKWKDHKDNPMYERLG